MSLKAFHILFIVVSIGVILGFCAWSVLDYRTRGDSMILGFGVMSGAAGVGLLVYVREFYFKD